MEENTIREQMDYIMDMTKDIMIDSFADLIKMLNDRNYDDAALMAHSLASGMALFSQGLATEALTRRLSEGLDKPE